MNLQMICFHLILIAVLTLSQDIIDDIHQISSGVIRRYNQKRIQKRIPLSKYLLIQKNKKQTNFAIKKSKTGEYYNAISLKNQDL